MPHPLLAILLVFQGLISLESRSMVSPSGPHREVQGQVMTSEALPAIAIRVADVFTYVGAFDFRIRDLASGQRYVFVDAEGTEVERLFVFQFEGWLPGVDEIYRYSFDDALDLGGHKFRHNAGFYSTSQLEQESPGNEASMMAEFLETKGYEVEDELVMSRFVTLGDESRRHELILFYIETAAATGHTLAEFEADGETTALWESIAPSLYDRSLRAFEVLAE